MNTTDSSLARLILFLLIISIYVFASGEIVDRGESEYGIFHHAAADRFITLTSPKYITIKEAGLNKDEPVMGLVINGDARCYPLRLMWYHHIVNDKIGGQMLAVAYCIMANTATTYKLKSLDEGLIVTGLYGGVLAMGRADEDYVWPQIADVPVPDNPTTVTLEFGPEPVLTTFGRWAKAWPDSKVLSPVDKFDFYYEAYDHRSRGYRPNPLMNQTVTHRDERLEPGCEVLGVTFNGEAAAWPLDVVKGRGRFEHTIAGQKISVEWDKPLETARVTGAPDEVLWMRSFWYAWCSFYPDTVLPDVGEMND